METTFVVIIRLLLPHRGGVKGRKKNRKKINPWEEKDGTESAPFGNQAKERRREGKADGRRGARQDLGQKREKVGN